MTRCPCRGCADRTLTCHGVCARYQEWKKELDETKKWLNGQVPGHSEQLRKMAIENLRYPKKKWKGKLGGDT